MNTDFELDSYSNGNINKSGFTGWFRNGIAKFSHHFEMTFNSFPDSQKCFIK